MTNSNEIHYDNSRNLFVQLKEKMIEIYGEMYFQFHTENEFDERKYTPAKNSVARSILISLYNNFVSIGECEPIENIPTENKMFYWELSKKMTESKEVMIKCAKSMYCLDLITNNYNPCQKNLSKKEIVP